MTEFSILKLIYIYSSRSLHLLSLSLGIPVLTIILSSVAVFALSHRRRQRQRRILHIYHHRFNQVTIHRDLHLTKAVDDSDHV